MEVAASSSRGDTGAKDSVGPQGPRSEPPAQYGEGTQGVRSGKGEMGWGGQETLSGAVQEDGAPQGTPQSHEESDPGPSAKKSISIDLSVDLKQTVLSGCWYPPPRGQLFSFLHSL